MRESSCQWHDWHADACASYLSGDQTERDEFIPDGAGRTQLDIWIRLAGEDHAAANLLRQRPSGEGHAALPDFVNLGDEPFVGYRQQAKAFLQIGPADFDAVERGTANDGRFAGVHFEPVGVAGLPVVDHEPEGCCQKSVTSEQFSA